jgi:hypothetical protein
VQRARQAAAETSGAVSGARVAAYLRAGEPEQPPATEKILERLALPETAKPAVPPQPAAQTGPSVNEQKLETLTRAAEPATTPAKPVVAREEPADLSKADEKLSSLLGDKK